MLDTHRNQEEKKNEMKTIRTQKGQAYAVLF